MRSVLHPLVWPAFLQAHARLWRLRLLKLRQRAQQSSAMANVQGHPLPPLLTLSKPAAELLRPAAPPRSAGAATFFPDGHVHGAPVSVMKKEIMYSMAR